MSNGAKKPDQAKKPDLALQLGCQHEILAFKEGSYVIVCRRCEKTWTAVDVFGMPDVSMKAQQIFVPTRCQQFQPQDTSPAPTTNGSIK